MLLESGYRVQGCDSSENAIVHCKATYPEAEFFRCAGDSAESLLSRERYSLIVCWGVLHYLTEENARELLSALCASLIPGGFLLGTLRKDSDTQFTHSAVGDSGIRLSNETELVRFLESQFTDYQYGFMAAVRTHGIQFPPARVAAALALAPAGACATARCSMANSMAP